MKLYLTIFLLLIFLQGFAQKTFEEKMDSIFVTNSIPSYSKLNFIENCNLAIVIADDDIKKSNILLLIVGGIGPTTYVSDTVFENKFKVKYYDYGCIAAKDDCMTLYNDKIFDYLTITYGSSWENEIRKDVWGLKKWKKEKK